MTRPIHPETATSQELLEQGRLALKVLQYREQAARYLAEASQLEAAMLNAESGATAPLKRWLETNQFALADVVSHAVSPDISPNISPNIATTTKESISVIDIGEGVCELSIARSQLDVGGSGGCDLAAGDEPTPAMLSLPEPIESTSGIAANSVANNAASKSWARMVAGAAQRLEDFGDACSLELSPSNVIQNDLPPNESNSNDSTAQDAEPSEGEFVFLKEGSNNEPIEESQLISVSEADVEKPPVKRVATLMAAHVWVSLAVHVGLVVALSIVVITAAKKQEMLSIVSSPVEAENVLMETPMEMVSELETASLEPMAAVPTPELSDVVVDVSIPEATMEPGAQPKPMATASSAVAQSNSEIMQAGMGSKVATGVEFFGVKATGNTFVYIIDCSPSMRKDNAFQAAKNEVFRSLASMKPKQRFFISFFGKEIDRLTFQSEEAEKYPVYATKENVVETQEWMNRVAIQKDGWPPNDALEQAIAMQPDGIFMLFDGETKVDVAKFLRQINRTDDILSEGAPKVPVHVIHFFQEEFAKQMMRVAQENNGTYRFIPKPDRSAANMR